MSKALDEAWNAFSFALQVRGDEKFREGLRIIFSAGFYTGLTESREMPSEEMEATLIELRETLSVAVSRQWP